MKSFIASRDTIPRMPELLKTATFWGFIINFMGLVVGIGGIVFAVRSSQKLKGARQATLATEKKLFNHMATEHFNNIARDASEIATLLLLPRDLSSATKMATGLQLSLANAVGSWGTLLSSSEKDILVVAKRSANSLLEALQAQGTAPEIQVDALTAMLGSSRFIIEAAGGIAGRLKVANLTEAEELQ